MESHLVLNVPLRSLYVRKCNICPLPTCLLWQVSSTSLFPIYESCNEILRLWKGNWPSWWEDDPRHKSSGFAFHEGIFQFLFLSFLSSAVFHEYPTQLMNMHWQVCIFRDTKKCPSIIFWRERGEKSKSSAEIIDICKKGESVQMYQSSYNWQGLCKKNVLLTQKLLKERTLFWGSIKVDFITEQAHLWSNKKSQWKLPSNTLELKIWLQCIDKVTLRNPSRIFPSLHVPPKIKVTSR